MNEHSGIKKKIVPKTAQGSKTVATICFFSPAIINADRTTENELDAILVNFKMEVADR